MIASIRGKKPHIYRVIILKQMADHNTVPYPDLEITGEGPVSPQFFFWSLGPQFGLDPPLQHNLVPRASWLPSLLLAIILYYKCHFLNITTVLQIWSMLHAADYEELA